MIILYCRKAENGEKKAGNKRKTDWLIESFMLQKDCDSKHRKKRTRW